MANEIILSEEQTSALTLIINWLKLRASSPQEFRLGGYAGTGKTTIIKRLLEICHDENISTVVCAFTGKAVNVLSRKGVYGSTMHSLMYSCEQTKDGMIFTKRSRLECSPDLFIIDEASMISTELYNDLKSFGTKLLFVGDPGQLEPVGENPNLMAIPDIVLSKIHRQVAESPIIQFATDIRYDKPMRHFQQGGLSVEIKHIDADKLFGFDQVICATNKVRASMNQSLRRLHMNDEDFRRSVTAGDKLIVLRNNMQYEVFNGMILFVDEIIADENAYWLTNCIDETDRTYRDLKIWKWPFLGNAVTKTTFVPKNMIYCDYGYCITCHKSQGSEWDKVAVLDEYMPPHIWDMKRWRYTAVTRAAKELNYLL